MKHVNLRKAAQKCTKCARNYCIKFDLKTGLGSVPKKLNCEHQEGEDLENLGYAEGEDLENLGYAAQKYTR